MRCPTCGVTFEAPTRFCPADGTPLVPEGAAVPTAGSESPVRPFVIGLIGAIVIGAVAVGAFWLGVARPASERTVRPDLPPAPRETTKAVDSDVVFEAAERAEEAAMSAAMSADAAAMAAEVEYDEVDDYDEYVPAERTAIMGGLFDVPGNADRRVAALRRAGFEAYASPERIFQGYDGRRTLVAVGPFSRAEAIRMLPAVRRVVPDAFVKELVLR